MAKAEFFDELLNSVEVERTVPVDGWKEPVRLVRLDTADRLAMVNRQATMGNDPDQSALYDYGAILVSLSVVDDAGNRPFDNEKGRTFLRCMDVQAMQTLLTNALQLNGLGEGLDADEEQDQAKKN